MPVEELKVLVTRGNRRSFRAHKRCSEYREQFKELWSYSASNRGRAVLLCHSCQGVVLKRFFGKADALDGAVRGGLFERDRSKY